MSTKNTKSESFMIKDHTPEVVTLTLFLCLILYYFFIFYYFFTLLQFFFLEERRNTTKILNK